MDIRAIDLYRLEVPLHTPFKTAVREVNSAQSIVVAIHTDDGSCGWGAAPATAKVTGETLDTIAGVIRDPLSALLIGRPLEDFNGLLDTLHGGIEGNYSAKAALEIALYDLRARSLGVPLYKLFGGDGSPLQTDLTISVNPPKKMVTDASHAVANGYRILKLKVGNDVAEDLERITAVHAAVGDGIQLRLDINQGWSAKETVRALAILEKRDIVPELLEQPVPAEDIAGLRYIRERVAAPVMADESVFSPMQTIRLLEQGAADIINIKLMKAGGLSRALLIAQIARLYGAECMMGCMLETSISAAAAAHLTSAFGAGIQKIDLDAPGLCQYDAVTGATRFDGPSIELNHSPGLGIEGPGHIRGLTAI
ncbi:dipeptide epimerase [Biformimicrobium ophioploci]|uniref:Dipeptide epimerase n=1 Tax=Biformimicrobium ophioploci TaxID=3036711 RepID=A0ABQ6LWU4_9GAMM|nr:dipeptide epimerase [Microbulbifer sp. NKW57]GMG86541.1 dipeptide epimerase [Microbulbifer sp. NKW57]